MDEAQLPARTRVVVVGAGPAGLTLAVTLAQAGVDHVLLDAQAEGANTSRAAVVHARTLEVLDGLGAADPLVERGLPVTRFAVRDGARPLLTVPFDRLPTRYPFALMVPQWETEAVLLARLHALGHDVHRPHAVVGLAQDDHGVRVTTASGAVLHAELVVGADGMHSTVREQAGIRFTGEAYAQSFVLADVSMAWEPGRDEVSLTFGRLGLTVVAPLPGGWYRVVATAAEAPERPDLADLQRLLDERAPGQAAVADVAWSSRFRVHHRLAEHYRAGRVLLAGDAAHVHSPAGGQGMNLGIQDAHALGRAIATGDLDAYEAVRRPVAQHVVRLTDRMTRVATTSDPAARAVRNVLLRLAARVPALTTRVATDLSGLGQPRG